MKNLLLACCDCSPPDIPCKQCNSNRCVCNPAESSESQIPVTSINVEVSNLSVGVGTSRGASDVSYAHFWSKDLQNINENGLTGLKNRPVLDNNGYLHNGHRYGDAFSSGSFRSKLSGCSVGSRIGEPPESYGLLDVPCVPPPDSSNPNGEDLTLPACECRVREDSEWPCRDVWCDYFENLLTQGFSNGQTWNWHPDSCSDQELGGTNFTLEFDWPCKETEAAFDRAQAKYDYGQQQKAIAESYCANNPNDEKCGNGQSSCPVLCHPAAKEEIGAQPPSLVPCITTCPDQYPNAVCDYSKEVRYPNGNVAPFGDFVEHEIGCVSDLDGKEGCYFRTKPVAKNWGARVNCTHQCGAGCGGQRCCDIDCFEEGCCDQLLYNPLTGETVEYNEDGCIVDENGNPIGGWKLEPNALGEYERCSKPPWPCTDEFGNITVDGCRRDLENGGNVECTGEDPCCPSGSGPLGGDVRQWIIPRLMHPELSTRTFGTAKPPQGIYTRHCPDTVDPFIPRSSRFYDPEKCSNLNAPTISECKGGPLFGPCEYPDKHCIWLDEHNPRGMICDQGICTPAISWNGGEPFHVCNPDDPFPATHNPAFCGDNPCEDQIRIDNDTTGDPRGCDRSGCFPDCPRDITVTCSDCYPKCPSQPMAHYTSGTNEYEMGLQHVSIACKPTMLEENYTVWDGVFNDWASCAEGPPRQLYQTGSSFVVATEWEGGGDAVIDFNKVSRTGNGSYSLAQSAEQTDNNCIFGTYDRLVGGTGWVVGGPSLPGVTAQAQCTDWADIHSSCYYSYVGPFTGPPDCSELARQRVHVEYRAPSSIPTVFIT